MIQNVANLIIVVNLNGSHGNKLHQRDIIKKCVILNKQNIKLIIN